MPVVQWRRGDTCRVGQPFQVTRGLLSRKLDWFAVRRTMVAMFGSFKSLTNESALVELPKNAH